MHLFPQNLATSLCRNLHKIMFQPSSVVRLGNAAETPELFAPSKLILTSQISIIGFNNLTDSCWYAP